MSKAPKLRFKEFNGDWHRTTLKQVTNSFEYGMNAAATEFDGKNKYIRITDIDENTSKYLNENVVSPLGELEEKYLVKENDILFARTGASTGKTYLYDSKDGKLYFAGFLIRSNVNNDNNAKFIFLQTKTRAYDKWVKVMSMRSGQPGINSQEYASYSFYAPSKEEQEKIASFLSLIDDKISLQGEKMKMLKDYKTGMMQKIFSRELRFKDDEDRDYPEWEEKKLGDCIENKGGTALEKFVDENGTHKFISIGNYSTSGKYIDSGQRISLNDKTKDKLLYKNDLVMVLNDKTATGDLIGSTILIDEDNTYIYNQRSERLICNENINPDFAWILLNYEDFRKRVFSIAQGGTQIYVNFPSVKNLNIQLPSLKEQNKISELILALDNKIEKEQEKLDSLNEYKKGLLQQMFV